MLNYLKDATNISYTENGAQAFATTKDNLVDFFAQAGAMRQRSDNDIINMFTAAFGEDQLLAMRMLFYFRDIRSGQGERRLFRVITHYLADYHTDVIRKNLHLIPEFGRYDDLYIFVGTRLESAVAHLFKIQFAADMDVPNPTQMGKWLKSENASSQETVRLARWTMKILGLTPRAYRKALTILRKKINIVESQMSAEKWHLIQYDKLPSKAGLNYREAFNRHDPVRYQEFLDAVSKGEKKVNAGTLYPYEILEQLPFELERIGGKYYILYGDATDEAYLNAAWDNLPNYFGEAHENSLVVVDTSGSMRGRPAAVALSFGIYIAERNKGLFHNHFISFSAKPTLQDLKGSTFCEKVRSLSRTDWDMNTNIEAVFDLILNTAVDNRLSPAEMPRKIYVVSDMQFDRAATENTNIALFREIRSRFENAGYLMPVLVFWNVNATSSQYPMTVDDRGILFVSGASPSILTNLLKGKVMDATSVMMDTINSDRYQAVTV